MKQKNFHRMSSFEISERNACLNLMKCVLIVSQVCVFTVTWFRFYSDAIYQPYYYWGNWAVVGVFAIIFTLFAQLYGGFHINTSRASGLTYSLFIGSVFSTILTYCIICLLSYKLANPLPLLAVWGIGFLLSIVWAQLAVLLNDHLFPPKQTYVIYSHEESYEAIRDIQKLDWKFSVIGSLWLPKDSENLDEIFHTISQAEAVFLCGVPSSIRNTILKFCIEEDIQVYIRPNIGDILVSGASRLHMMHFPILHCCRNRSSFWYKLISRTMDIIISGTAIIVTSPIMLITALAIHFYDRGPVLYKQVRLTENGKQFRILKFRSMRTDAEKDGVARLASENDSRITPIGRVIRKCRIDELPQLFNILWGDMAIVGPRPERPEIAEQYEQEMPEFRLRLQVKAGLTGYAQVFGKYNTQPYDKLEMDLLYIANQSIIQDIWLMFATVKILFMSESTEGIAEGKTTAGKENITI